MIRITQERLFTEDGKRYCELAGLSTDSKPTTGIITGSMFLEVDTGKAYAFDETGDGTWYELGAQAETPADAEEET